ncbi:MAG: AAA family ATPase [Desulfovibrio sp.]|jgi:uncharacterized protein YhaN|nr:AAA family ATPase [Desulfovibrio sp.]
MYIEGFNISRFLGLSGVLVDSLGPGLNIFYGENEAGKSSCQAFLRVMLMGFPKATTDEGKELKDGKGCLDIVCRNKDRMRICRDAKTTTLHDGAGSPMELLELQTVLGGITPDVYRNVFGFTLFELERFESLSKSEVNSALYGASFGPGMRSPGVVTKDLDARMKAIFRPSGTKQPLNEAMTAVDTLGKQIAALEEKYSDYDRVAQALHDTQAKLAELTNGRHVLEQERQVLLRRLGAWRQWEQWSHAVPELRRLGPGIEGFPEDGPARLAKLQEARRGCERQKASQEAELERKREHRDMIVENSSILDALSGLRRLAERKSGYMQALNRIPSQEETLRRLLGDLERNLLMLGQEWTCERIKATDRTLSAKERMEDQAKEMTMADTMHRAAQDALIKCNRDVEVAERDLVAARKTLEELKVPEAMMDDEDRDNLRRILARVEEVRRMLPGKERALQSCRTTFMRAYEPLRLMAREGKSPGSLLETLIGGQEEALELAAVVSKSVQEVNETQQELQQAEEGKAAMENQLAKLKAQVRDQEVRTRESLDGRVRALRALRGLAGEIRADRQWEEELRERKAEAVPVGTSKKIIMMLIGALIMIAGIVGLVITWDPGVVMNLHIHDMTFAVTPVISYCVVVLGGIVLAIGLPRSGAEVKRYRKEMEQIETKLSSTITHLKDLEASAEELCEIAQVEDYEPETLDDMELELEEERERCIHEERTLQDIEDLKQRVADAGTQLERIRSRKEGQEADLQVVRRRWHSFMQGIGVSSVPSPESAGTFFGKAETALVLSGNLDQAEAELRDVNEELEEQEGRIRIIPAIADRLTGARNVDEVMERVQNALESFREVDAVLDQRLKAQMALESREQELVRSRNRQTEAVEEMRKAEERLAEARNIWAERMDALGLGRELSPQTVWEAFGIMDKCLETETQIEKAKSEYNASKMELARLQDPLEKVVTALGRAPVASAGGEADWIATLDQLLDEGEAAVNAREERARRTRLVEDAENTLRQTIVELAVARDEETRLLAMAGVDDAEAFLKLCREDTERKRLQQQVRQLEDDLRSSCGAQPFEEFVASFRQGEQEINERRKMQIDVELGDSEDMEKQLAKDVGALQAKELELSDTTELSRLRRERSVLLERMEELRADWCRLALAKEIVERAQRRFETERQPRVIKLASENFSRITGGDWEGLQVSLEKRELSALPRGGQPTAPEKMSCGARQQAYLSLRLAFIKNHAEHAEPLPVLMDEVLVNFDAQRARHTAKAFAQLVSDPDGAHQLLYFTCHWHMVELLRAAIPQAVIFKVAERCIAPMPMPAEQAA